MLPSFCKRTSRFSRIPPESEHRYFKRLSRALENIETTTRWDVGLQPLVLPVSPLHRTRRQSDRDRRQPFNGRCDPLFLVFLWLPEQAVPLRMADALLRDPPIPFSRVHISPHQFSCFFGCAERPASAATHRKRRADSCFNDQTTFHSRNQGAGEASVCMLLLGFLLSASNVETFAHPIAKRNAPLLGGLDTPLP